MQALLKSSSKKEKLKRQLSILNIAVVKGNFIKKKKVVEVLAKLEKLEKAKKSKSEKLIKQIITSFLWEIVAVDPSARPPKKWWTKMYKQIKKRNPNYTDEMIRSTIGKIWYHHLSTTKKSEIRKREGKKLK